MTLGDKVVHFDLDKTSFKIPNFKNHQEFWSENEKRFQNQIKAKVPSKAAIKSGGMKLSIDFKVKTESLDFSLDFDESYTLNIKAEGEDVLALIEAETFFGARHALETLSQLVAYDDIRSEIQIVRDVTIEDKPVYKYRGLALDTSRNWFSIESIKRTIDAMSMVKLNTFHWHITDSHSFPMEIKSHPDLLKFGAYTSYKTYSAEEIKDVVKYAKLRGVRVLPEFDAPAHVGEGWQKKNMTACFNYQPWQQFCVEPPCGQLDPTKDALYDVLDDIYREMYEMFDSPDMFHMGGDEVSLACWNSSQEIQTWMKEKGYSLSVNDFMKLWGHFQDNALARLEKYVKKDTPLIMWTSKLTEIPFVDNYLNKDKYIIQVWTKGDDTQITNLLEKGYRLILSNYDALYLDCGFGGWVTDGNNWCSPYIGWQKVYSNSPSKIGGAHKSLILGAEAALWSEQADEYTLDSRLWPRLSALAERLWSDPSTTWRDAESRMLIQRERLVENGIGAESIQPEWCLKNEGQCPL